MAETDRVFPPEQREVLQELGRVQTGAKKEVPRVRSEQEILEYYGKYLGQALINVINEPNRDNRRKFADAVVSMNSSVDLEARRRSTEALIEFVVAMSAQ